jgi:hypothetical protein
LERPGILADKTGVLDRATLERAEFESRVAPSTGFVDLTLLDFRLLISDFFWIATECSP